MMTYPRPVARPVILRARRDTIALVAMAALSTFALAHVVQSRRAAAPFQESVQEPRQTSRQTSGQVWTGGLSGVALPQADHEAAAEPLTSASLVVPDLALPQAPVRPLVKLRGCGGDSCAPRPAGRATSVPMPPRKIAVEMPPQRIIVADNHVVARREKKSLMARLNPLEHLPSVSTIRKPFAIAGDTVSGWFKGF